jgi:hypothetical protein
MAQVAELPSLDEVLSWLSRLEAAPRARATGVWPLAAVLEHLAQSIAMSLHGFPQPRSALFQRSAGAAAFAVFRWRGRMKHGLDQPIPGAPALPMSDDWHAAAQHLRGAIQAYQTWRGPLQPHFAYGLLRRGDYTLAHRLHIADHRREIVFDPASPP